MHRATFACFHNLVAYAQAMRDVQRLNAIAVVRFFLRAVTGDARNQNKIRTEILREA